MRRIKLRIAVVAVTALLFLSMQASGQTSTANDWSRLNSISPGTGLEINQKGGKTISGKLIKVSDSVLSVSAKGKSVVVNRGDVAAVYQVTKKSATMATLIGLGVGAGAGLGVGLAGRSDNGFEKIDNAVTAGLAVLGAGAGALTGYLIGRSGRKKELVYQAN